jgi:hypothetical protein
MRTLLSVQPGRLIIQASWGRVWEPEDIPVHAVWEWLGKASWRRQSLNGDYKGKRVGEGRGGTVSGMAAIGEPERRMLTRNNI